MRIFSLILLGIAFTGCSDQDKPERVKEIDAEIQALEKKAMDDEMQSMDAFRSNYSKFARELEESEESEEKARELEREKEAILNQ